MRVASLIARYLLGVIFVVFGLNGFLNFIPQPPLPPGDAMNFFSALVGSHYMVVVFLLELGGGFLLLLNRYIPLALVLLGPVIVNIFLFHLFMQPAGLPMAFIVIACWILVASNVRTAFSGIMAA